MRMDIQTFASTLDRWGKNRTPFIFIVDFELEMPMAWRLDEIDASAIRYSFNGISNQPATGISRPVRIEPLPGAFSDYTRRFDLVMNALLRGDSFLTNLTISTPVRVNTGLGDIFHISDAKYKFMLGDTFLVFSPETFVRISDNVIRTFPMKGTISADMPDAYNTILADEKEKAEHTTIVDLLRNDLSMIADEVRVERFRFVEEIKTNRKSLLQVSSEISGRISPEFRDKPGSLLVTLLPAGSVSGAPKAKTLEVISAAENGKRGYYTGVCGYFDGESLDSGVMIRYIEQRGTKLFFRSGAGITTQSDVQEEYRETLDKIYVPVP